MRRDPRWDIAYIIRSSMFPFGVMPAAALVNHHGGCTIHSPTRLRFGFETVGGCGGANIKYIKNMENELQGNTLGTGFTGNGFDISLNPNVSSLDGFFVKERCDRFSMALASLCTTITSDKIHLIKTTKLLRV